MHTVLLPIDASAAARGAVRHVIRESRKGDLEVHLLNVQRPLSRHVAQFVSRSARQSFHHDESERALRPMRKLLDDAGVAYAIHTSVGHPAEAIAAAALRLGCDHIVMGTARRSSIGRALGSSVMNQVLELTRVPVVVIAGDKPPAIERYGVPAAVGSALALLLAAAAD